MKLTLGFLALAITVLTLPSLPASASSVVNSVAENQAPTEARSANLHFGNQFLPSNTVGAADPINFFLGSPANTPSTTQIFVGRATYQINKDPSFFGANVFQSLQYIKYLMGSSYAVNLVSTSPFVIRATRSVLVGSITSDSAVQVFAFNQIGDALMRAQILSISGRNFPPQQVILQRLSNFNKYIGHAFLLTLVYADHSGGTVIELYSANTLRDDDFAGIPTFLQNKVISSMANGDLVGYVQRLAELK